MRQLHKLYFIFTLFVFFYGNIPSVGAMARPGNLNLPEENCELLLEEVQNESYKISNGQKLIITFSVANFKDEQECWEYLEEYSKELAKSSEIVAVHFFSLPSTEIEEIDSQFQNFEQYGRNLIATFWKDPDTGGDLKRYPNVVTDP